MGVNVSPLGPRGLTWGGLLFKRGLLFAPDVVLQLSLGGGQGLGSIAETPSSNYQVFFSSSRGYRVDLDLDPPPSHLYFP